MLLVVGCTLSVVLLIKENKKVSKKTLQRSRLIVRNLKFEVSKCYVCMYVCMYVHVCGCYSINLKDRFILVLTYTHKYSTTYLIYVLLIRRFLMF